MKVLGNIMNLTKEEWLEIRGKGIGGSDAAAVLGINRWKSRFELYIEKLEGSVELNSEAVYWGTILEDVVAAEFEVRTGKKVRRNNRVLQSEEYPWMIANIDREIVGEKAILECKTTSAYNAKEWDGDEVPSNYIVQVQHYMAVTGAEKAYIAVLVGGQRFVWKEIPRDQDLIDLLIQEEARFWSEHVLKKIPPEIDGSKAASDFLKGRYDSMQDKVKALSHVNLERVQRIEELQGFIKPYEDEKKALENAVKLEMEDAEEGYIGDKYVIKYKTIISNRVDPKKLKNEHPEVYTKVLNQSKSRRFEIKEV